MLSSWKIYF